MTAAEPFSLLMPVYAGDNAQFFERAFDSVTVEQQVRPNELVLVQDGPIGETLGDKVDELCARSVVPVRRLTLPHNRGLARALAAGLAVCEHEIVARMDADDISRPDRFARQIPLMVDGHDIVGSAIQEFHEEGEPGLVRTPPLSEEAIVQGARFHSPFNHPTVVLRKSAVLAAGGYQELDLLEDYWLFARMIARGVRALNLAEPLLDYRVGAGAYARRGGLRLFRAEFTLQWRFHRIGFTTYGQMVRNIAIRCGYRLIPEGIRRRLYRKFVSNRAA